MKIAIVDADLIGRKKHRFPNLACEKISGYHKENGDEVRLVMSWEEIDPEAQVSWFDEDSFYTYEKIYISKVFTDTVVPRWVTELNDNRVQIGGTGFYYDKAPNLPDEIEHHMPDYHLYDEWIEDMVRSGIPKKEFKSYTDYSIGFLTRGCFRKCSFCVNQKYDRVLCHSPLEEFYDPERKKICMLDDNFLGHPKWKEMLKWLIDTGKPFKFMQGLDERILTREKCEMLFNAKYDGYITFAFDNIEDYELIESKLKMIRSITDKKVNFYVLVGFDRNGKYDDEFWANDIRDMFTRIELLGKYRAVPYIMRFERLKESPYEGIYSVIATWCNKNSFFIAQSLNEFIDVTYGRDAPKRYREKLLRDYPEFEGVFEKRLWKEEKKEGDTV